MERKEEDFLPQPRKELSLCTQHQPLILSSVIAAYTFAVFIVTYQSFLPVFAKDVLQVGPRGSAYCWQRRDWAASHRLVSSPRSANAGTAPCCLWVMTTTTPIFLILFCFSPIFWLSVALLTLVGAGQVCFRTMSRVIIQIEAPRTLMGRVMSVFNLDQGMRSVGSIVLGAAATFFGASLGIALTAAASLVITTALFYRLLGKREG